MTAIFNDVRSRSRFQLNAATCFLAVIMLLITSIYAQAASVGQNWYWINPLPQGNLLNDVAWDGTGTYVAVGRYGTIVTSPDLITWTVQTTGTTNDLSAVVWANNEFVAVGYSGTILTSPKGVTWTAQTSGTNQGLNSVIWDGSQFVAVGAGGSILTSSAGATWTAQNSGTTNGLNAIVWTGSQFVTVGDTGTILTSPAGAAWTSRTSGTSNSLQGISWNSTQFVAVGYGGTVLTSSAGTSWTSHNLSTSDNLTRVVWANGQFVALYPGYNSVYTSTDGTTWVTNYTPVSIYSVFWSGSTWVGVGAGAAVYTSTDAATWTLQNPGATATVAPRTPLQHVVWTGSEFLAFNPSTLADHVIASPDGANWVTRSLGGLYFPADAACSSTLCVAVGNGGNIITSSDEITWTAQSSGITTALKAVVWDGAQFLAVGDSGIILASSGGSSWVQKAVGVTTANLKDITAGNGTLVAVGDAGTILTSTDSGATWSSQSTNSTDIFSAVTYGASKFVAVGYGTLPYVSADGLSWSSVTGLPYNCNDVIWAGLQFVTVYGSTIFTSPDAVTWTSHVSGTSNTLASVAWNGDTQVGAYVAVGNSGTILESAPAGVTGTQPVTITQPNTGSETFNVTGIGTLAVSVHSSNQNVLPDANITGAGTCTAMGSCTVTLQPGAYKSGSATVTVTVTDSRGQSGSASFAVTVNPPPAPTVSGTSAVTITQPNKATETFTITGTGALGVSVQSNNPTIIPTSSITGYTVCTAAGSCTLTLQAAAGQTGNASVAVFLNDNYGQSTSSTISVTVNPPAPPAISGTSSVTITEGSSGSETFSLAGTGTLTLSATSNNQALLPDTGITGTGTCTGAGGCTLALQPAANQTGSGLVTLTLTDAYGQSSSGSFAVTVNAPSSATTPTGTGTSSSGGGGAMGLWTLLGLLSLAGLSRATVGGRKAAVTG